MRQKRDHNIIEGAFILIVAVLIVKLIGALFKIPLTEILGGSGMGYFMSAYSLFNPVQALAAAGLPVAVSKMVSENMARGNYRNVRQIFRVSFALFVVTGIVGTLGMFFFAPAFTRNVGNPNAVYAVACLAPAVLFGCLTSAFRGYYEGTRNMYPTAISQVIEALVKLFCGIFFASFVIKKAAEQYAATGMVFGTLAESAAHAETLAMPYAAAGAALGISVSCLAGMLFLMLRYGLGSNKITREMLKTSPDAMELSQTVSTIIRTALPVCLSSVVVNLSGLIDLTTIINRLEYSMSVNSQALIMQYSPYLPKDMELSGVANYLYGSYTALAGTIFNIVPSLTSAFGTSALPAISASVATRNYNKTYDNISSVIRITAMIVIPAGLGIAAMAEPVLMFFFASRPGEVAIAAPLLTILGVAVIFSGLTPAINSMLQAVGRADIPVYLMLGSGLIKFVGNYIFIAQPEINILAAPCSTFVCYMFMAVIGMHFLSKNANISISYKNIFLKPLIAGIFCAVGARTSYSLLVRVIGMRISTIIAIGIGVLLYITVLILINGVTKKDILMLPGGEKIAKTLEKFCHIR